MKFPNVFDLKEPTGYYQTICVPRQERQLKRYLNQHMHRIANSPKAGEVGEEPEGSGGRAPGGAPSSLGSGTGGGAGGGGKRGTGGAPGSPAKMGGGPPTGGRAFPAGKRLATAEVRQSVQHTPTYKSGKTICWDSCTWAGCSRTAKDCAHNHEPIKGLKGLN